MLYTRQGERMTSASSMNERALDDSVDADFSRSRQSGIVDVIDAGDILRLDAERRGAFLADVDRGDAQRSTFEPSTFEPSTFEPSTFEPSAVDPSVVDRKFIDPEHVEREASPVASAVESGTGRDEDIDITTDDGAAPLAEAKTGSGDEGIIEVSDDEIETAEPPPVRTSQPSLSTIGGLRSRPPAPPSSRPHMPRSSLPPPRSSRPSGIDPWALANRTLELSRANAYIVELEELVAFREARILELDENLTTVRRKLADLERRLTDQHRSRQTSTPATAAAALVEPGEHGSIGVEVELPLITEARPALVLPVSSADSQRGSEVTQGDVAQGDSAGNGARLEGAQPRDSHAEGDSDAPELTEDPYRYSGFGSADARLIPRHGSEDDLQQINGIGPRFEAALRKQGITRLSQIAAWSEADVRQVAKALKIPKSRIVKGRWVEVAREVIGTRAASE
jgi:predicted flap endonuclease-1-like 5' DNA nuclease